MTGTGADPHPMAPDSGPRADGARRHPVTAVDDICPYLRAEGGEWRSAHPSRAHRCGAIEPPVPLATTKQRSLCLGRTHQDCVTYLAAREGAAEPGWDAPTATGGLWPETRSTPVLLDPPHAVLAPLAGGPARTGGQALLVGLMVLAFIVLVVARTSTPGAAEAPSPGSSAGVGVLPSTTAPASTSPAPSPTQPATMSPAATPTPAGVASPSPAPTPTPAPSVRRYTVRSGDTLNGIADRFNTTVKAIKVANGLQDNLIRPGQVLVIP